GMAEKSKAGFGNRPSSGSISAPSLAPSWFAGVAFGNVMRIIGGAGALAAGCAVTPGPASEAFPPAGVEGSGVEGAATFPAGAAGPAPGTEMRDTSAAAASAL